MLFDLAETQPGSLSRATLEVDVDVFRTPGANTSGDCLVYLNGNLVAGLRLEDRAAAVSPVSPALLQRNGNRLTLVCDKALRPLDYGVSDTRLLGLQLFTLRVAAG